MHTLYLLHFLRCGMLFPILPLYCEHLHFSPALIGIIVSAQSILSIPLAIPLGRIMDRISPIIGVKVGFLLNCISSVLLLGFKNFFGVISSQLIAGLGFLLIVVGAQTTISSTMDYYKKAKGFAQLSLFGSIGQVFGPFLGGLIVTHFNFSLVFLITLLISLPGLFIKTPKKRSKDIIQKDKSNISLIKDISDFLKEPNVIIILLFTSIAVFITSLRNSFLPIFLKNNSYNADTIGILISIFSITMSIVRIFIARIFKTIQLNKLMYLTLFLFFIGLSIIPLTNNLIVITIGISLWGGGFGISQPLSMLLMSENIQREKSGLGMGLRFTAINLSTSIAPIVFGLITEYIKISYNFYFCSIIFLLFIGILYLKDVREKSK